jgi:hypothetical protein
MHEAVTSDMKDECEQLKDFVRDVTDKASAKSNSLQGKYDTKLDGIKEVCA